MITGAKTDSRRRTVPKDPPDHRTIRSVLKAEADREGLFSRLLDGVARVAKDRLVSRLFDTPDVLAIEVMIVVFRQPVDDAYHVLGREAFALLIEIPVERAHHVVQPRSSSRIVNDRQIQKRAEILTLRVV